MQRVDIMRRSCWASLTVHGVTPQTAPVHVRETRSLTRDGVAEALACLRGRAPRREWLVLSTCSRTEIYSAPRVAAVPASAALPARAAAGPGASRSDFGEAGDGPGFSPAPPLWDATDWPFATRGIGAARHFFRIACGLESIAIGDVQVLGQIRDAYEAACAAGTAGALVNRLCQTALYAGKRARAETTIACGAASMASAGVALAASTLGSLNDRHVLVVGMGQIGRAISAIVASHAPRSLVLATRSVDRLDRAARLVNGRSIPLTALTAGIAAADVVFCATGAAGTVLDRSCIAAAIDQRPARPLLIIDLAMPRDVDPAAADVPGVTLRSMESIEASMRARLSERSEAIPAVERIIDLALCRLAAWTPRLTSAA
jgi:glutamyl-tRNA reductase